MFKEILKICKEILQRFFKSRLFPVMLIYLLLFIVLITRLFRLQIVEQKEHMDNYIQKSLNTITTKSTRGNIYDRNGVILAKNNLVYSVTLKDTGVYIKQAQKNQWVYDLITLLDSCNETFETYLSLGLSGSDVEGEIYTYTSSSETQRLRLLRDVYGLQSTNQLDDAAGKYPSDISADDVVKLLEKKFYFERWVDENGQPIQVSPAMKLKMLNIRWALFNMRYTKYKSIVVSSNVKDHTVASVLEHADEIIGVDVEEEYVREYPDGQYFAHIIGYTGKASTDQLAELQLKDPNYEYGDIIGRSGVEELMELNLKGTKGERSMYLDAAGKVIEVISEEPAQVGNDVYLTIDHDLTIACYHILEQTLASVLLDKIVFEDVDTSQMDSDDVVIPIKSVYFQLINNNVLSTQHFSDPTAGEEEKAIYEAYKAEYAKVVTAVKEQLTAGKDQKMNDLDETLRDYMMLIYTYLSDNAKIIQTDKIEYNHPKYKQFIAGELSLHDFIYSAIANEWINTAAFSDLGKYVNGDDVYEMILKELFEKLGDYENFSKRIYKNLIRDEVISGSQICLALYSQNVLVYDSESIVLLKRATAEQTYEFMRNCIKEIKITPAQLALDPCNASSVVTDVKTGEVLAIVSYPGYDINRFSGTVEASYYSSLLNDASNPLYNYATQSRTSPGSTYKMLTSIAGLEEGVITREELIECLGVYDQVSPAPRCWIFRHDNESTHGPLNLVGGLANSCNYYFYEVGYRLSTDANGNYNETLGLARLKTYAEKFGFGTTSGIELDETNPMVSDAFPVLSAIGQGTNNYTTVQLARYVTAIASSGNLYSLSLIDRVADADGRTIEDFTPEVQKIEGVSQETFRTVQEGMRAVVREGTVREYFRTSDIDIAGKTGSAQEDIHRPNHAHFVSFAPYDNPEIAVTASIRNGYTSAYTAMLVRNIYEYYYNEITLEDLINRGASNSNSGEVGD